ncbi:MAG: hypothetical protein ABI543_12455 [Ignavibacteria bacterium]
MPGFSSSYSPLFLALFLIIAVAVSYFFYKNTAIEKNKKILLIIIKSLAIFFLLALFIEPVFSYLTGNNSSKRDIVLIDNSRSNLYGNKSGEITAVIKEAGIQNNEDNIFTFSNNTLQAKNTDSIIYNGFSTDLVTSLRTIKENIPDGSYNSIAIITDGIFNEGGNPIYEAGKFSTPFIVIAIGDTAVQKDVIVKNTAHNEKAFTGTATKIKAYITVNKVSSNNVNIKLIREGVEIKSQIINIQPGINNYEAEFEVTESEPGKVKYRVSAENTPDELTYKNNNSDFYITFIDNKVNILVISGGPGYDNEFTGSVLKRIGNYNITYRTQKSAGEFYEGGIDYKMFGELSTVFLLNYPTNVTSSAIISDITNSVKQFNVPVIFFAGKNTDYQKLNSFEDFIPFNISRPNSGESLFRLQPVNIDGNNLGKVTGLGSTNEIFRNVSGIMPKPGSVTIATDKASGEPVMINRISGNYRSTAFLGYGLWRWKLNPGTNAEKTLEAMLLEVINMTLQKEKRTKIRVYPQTDIFDYTQPVKIYAEVFDENYLPTRNAKVTGRVLRKDGSNAGELKFTAEENKFSAILTPLAAADYYIECDAELNGSYYARDNSRFTSDTVNTEYLETKTNTDVLRELASKSGGDFLVKDSIGNYSKFLDKYKNLPGNETINQKYLRFDLWGNKYYLMLVILLFSIEWVLRKRNNIP